MAPRSVIVPNSETPGTGPIHRNALSPEKLAIRPQDNFNSVYDVLLNGVQRWPNKPTLGARHVVNIIEEEKEVVKKIPGGGETTEIKKWKYFELSGFEWQTWSEVFELCKAYGSGLRSLGLENGGKITFYADTSRDWMTMALAASTQSFTVTTAYATLGEDGLIYSLDECEITTIYTTHDLLPMINKVASKVKTLKNVVYSGKAEAAHLEKLKNESSHLTVLSLEELKTLGEQTPFAAVPPKTEDLALIMYTSGSTGPPKGVMITHSNIVAGLAGANTFLLPYVSKARDEVYLAYLPLAHILEYIVEMAMLYMGASLGFGSVKTLTDGSVRNCKGDIRELRPHILAGVPQVWESIRKAVTAKLSTASPVMQKVFAGAFSLKWWLMSNGLTSLAAPLDAIVFSKIKDQVGGRLKFALSGGAPMPRSTQQFMNVAACTLIGGYGMTETTAIIAVQEPSMPTALGTVGAPFTHVEVKLADCPEIGYTSENKPKPQGEVWVRGPGVMKGYYKQPQLTKEAITEDGWLMTGDIGEWNADGTLTLIDRKKNLVKLSNGEYIALEKLEATYKVAAIVQNICVHADSEQTYAVALIQPIEPQVRALAAQLNLYPDVNAVDLAELCDHKDIRANVLKTLREIGKNVGFKPAELVGQVYLTHEEWTPQNGLLTAAMKLQRKAIQTRFKKEIAGMYKA
ncbi:hypothetical protein BJ741DRAFT_632570 [Chytriomyces cf. hyalinus JEL632]|nr:hypothetical protein BJ741DRAFT_632570 [Chytriomyces cf. hyalinus JEL632]